MCYLSVYNIFFQKALIKYKYVKSMYFYKTYKIHVYKISV